MADKVFAIFDTAAEAAGAAERLERQGVSRKAITMMSSEPVHSEIDRQSESHIGIFAIAGAMLGAASALLLTVLVSQHMNLNTGGMPVVAPWPFGIIVFEMTALGAILATLARMVYEARMIAPRPPEDCLEAIARGRVALAVDCRDEDVRRLTEALLSSKINPH
jgi:hypothetical protein